MIQVEFIYNSFNTIIQCNEDEKMKEIFKKIIETAGIDQNSIYFIYNENQSINLLRYLNY